MITVDSLRSKSANGTPVFGHNQNNMKSQKSEVTSNTYTSKDKHELITANRPGSNDFDKQLRYFERMMKIGEKFCEESTKNISLVCVFNFKENLHFIKKSFIF